MKKFAMILVGLTLGAYAFANTADQTQVILKCSSEVQVPDQGVGIVVTKGGLVGITQATVSERKVFGLRSQSYEVKIIPADPRRPGSPTVIKGKDFRLEVKGSVRPTADGRIYSVATYEFGGIRRVENLGCTYQPTRN